MVRFLKNKYIYAGLLLTISVGLYSTVYVQNFNRNQEVLAATLPINLQLKAPKAELLGSREVEPGVIKYVYRSNIRINDHYANSEAVQEAQKKGVGIVSEDVGKRTGHSRTYNTSSSTVKVTQFLAGNPQFYKDLQGNWWQAEYGTTTKDAFDAQTKNPLVLGFIERALGTTSTFFPDPNPESTSFDGMAWATNSNPGVAWATVHDDAGDQASNDTDTIRGYTVSSGTNTNAWREIRRAFFLFDTSSLPDTDTITSGTITLESAGSANTGTFGEAINIFASAPASNTGAVAADFTTLGTTVFSTKIEGTAWGASGTRNDFILNASGLAAISKTGVSKFGTRGADFDAPNTEPTWTSDATEEVYVKDADTAGTDDDPLLTVVHSVPVSTPSKSNPIIWEISRLFTKEAFAFVK